MLCRVGRNANNLLRTALCTGTLFSNVLDAILVSSRALKSYALFPGLHFILGPLEKKTSVGRYLMIILVACKRKPRERSVKGRRKR